jgi:hypothetical protein
VLQVVYVLACLLAHASSDSALSEELCGSSVVVETLIHLMHDKNPRLRELCDRCLETITVNCLFCLYIQLYI